MNMRHSMNSCILLGVLCCILFQAGESASINRCDNGDAKSADHWQTWSQWSKCTQSKYCFVGVQTRDRVCSKSRGCCYGAYVEQESCPKMNCKDLLPTVDSTSLFAPTSSFIAQECDSNAKFLASSKKGKIIPNHIWKAVNKSKDNFKDSYFNLKSYPASKKTVDPNEIIKVCFEPKSMTWMSVKKLLGLNRVYGASYYSPNSVKHDDHIVGVAVAIEKPDGRVVALYAAVKSPLVGYKVVGVMRWRGTGYEDAL